MRAGNVSICCVLVLAMACSAVGTASLASARAGDSAFGLGETTNMGSDDGAFDWSVLVYITADNDLTDLIQTDLDELMAVGSTPEVNVLALVDSLYGPAYMYRILAGDYELVDWAMNGEEVNMGDPATLTSFIETSDETWPSERKLLFFWDHGSGIKGVGFDETTADPDPEGGDWLSHQEVVQALTGHKVDIIASDECLVGQVEVAYEYSLGTQTEYLVASEGYIGYRGFTYDTILERLTADPGMSTRDAAVVMTQTFTEYFTTPPYMSEILTMQSVIDLSLAPQLVDDLMSLTELLCQDIETHAALISAAQLSGILPWGERGNAGVADLKHFAQYIADNSEDASVKAAAQTVVDDMSEIIVAMGTSKLTQMFNFEGLGVFFPHSYGNFVSAFGPTVELYEVFAFADAGWLDFLNTYLGVV